MQNFVTGFTGKMGSGKTTACDYMLTHFPKHVKVNFKDALVAELKKNFMPLLREMYHATIEFAIDGEPYYEKDEDMCKYLFKVKPPLVRKLLQGYGTEVRRADDPNYWVKQWKIEVQKQLDLGNWVVCDDVRFLNEAEAIHEMGGILVRIQRPDIVDTGTHSSETEMEQIGVSRIIETKQGDLESLYKQLDDLEL